MRAEADTRAFLTINADRMRFDPTEAEAKLWPALEALGFRCQCPILVPNRKYPQRSYPYVLDAYHEEKQICVEVDGGVHGRQRGRDRRRDERLRMAGIVTLRYTNREVLTNLDGVVAKIRAML